MKFAFPSLLLAVCLSFAAGRATEPTSIPFTVSHLFSDGMVAQRDVIVPIWGSAPIGASVRIVFDDAVQVVTADDDGFWQGEIPAHQAGGPHALTIGTGGQTLHVRDVWFGDVWVASGQSNMEWTVQKSNDAENEIRSANDPLIRQFYIPHSSAKQPDPVLAAGEWTVADPDHVGNFTAVGYFFARELRKTIDVPIGLVHTSWGGSRIEPWMSGEVLGMDTNALAATLENNEREAAQLRREFQQKFDASLTDDPGLKDGVAVWAAQNLDMSLWRNIEVPAPWESVGYARLDGVAWYRRIIELTAKQATGRESILHLSEIDDDDMTWINGSLVGETSGYTTTRSYKLSPGVLQPGTNTIVVRVRDGAGGGGIYGDAEDIRLETGSDSVPLAGNWKFRVGKIVVTNNARVNQLPTLLYNKMIHPIQSYPITGFLWYQGESNAGSEKDAMEYSELFQSLITSWRTAWNNPSAPFLFVSLANYRAAASEPGMESNWAVLRESQAAALSLPNVGQAITTDIGNPNDIHPRNKQDVGRRLALAARHMAFGEDLVYSGPQYRDHQVDGRKMIVSFDHVGSGLTAGNGSTVGNGRRGANLGGFEIAGADGRYEWAHAKIVDDTVVLSHRRIKNPMKIRYAWADNPDQANLYNRDGLPAVPFRR